MPAAGEVAFASDPAVVCVGRPCERSQIEMDVLRCKRRLAELECAEEEWCLDDELLARIEQQNLEKDAGMAARQTRDDVVAVHEARLAEHEA